jgi:osmoprotectant transport system permease protein
VSRIIGPFFRLAALALLLALVLRPEWFEPILKPFTENNAPVIYNQGSLLSLTLYHLGLVAVASLIGAALALVMGVFVTRKVGEEFLPLSRSLVNIGQTFPPVAVLALAVPVVGFGLKPTLIALVLYGLLPIFENTITGLKEVPANVVEAARGMGLNPTQQLFRVELPLALPVILAGIRLSVVINMGTATIGSTVAAKGLGEVIIAGLLTSNTSFILQGGIIVALLAVLIYDALSIIERRVARRTGRLAEVAG